MPGSKEPTDPLHQARIILRNQKHELGRLASFVQQFCDDALLGKETRFALDLSLTEWITNILNYGSLPSEGTIEIQLVANRSELRATVEDAGKIFNPLDRPEVDTNLPLDEKPIGGLGIFMIRRLMDQVAYERINNKNVLTLTKRFEAMNSPSLEGNESPSSSR